MVENYTGRGGILSSGHGEDCCGSPDSCDCCYCCSGGSMKVVAERGR